MTGRRLALGTRILSFFGLFLFSTVALKAATETVIHSFIPWVYGAGPNMLIADGQGNLYGSAGGGTYSQGIVFELSRNSNGKWQETVLYNFGTTANDGNFPMSGVTIDAAGNLYGTTELGGGYGVGTVYKLSPMPDGTWKETILHSFGALPDGQYPWGGVAVDSAGNVYGTTATGGTNGCEAIDPQCGIIFELSPASDGTWNETILYNFAESTGTFSTTTVLIDAEGNLYGTAEYAIPGGGSVWELSPSSTGWTFKVLHLFGSSNGYDGDAPNGLLLDAAGNLFGTTYGGGVWGSGTLFELQKGAGSVWKETVLYNFNQAKGGVYPTSGLIQDSAGNFYGTTTTSSNFKGLSANGTVFELSPNQSGGWTETTLYTSPGAVNSTYPEGVVFGEGGILYTAVAGAGTAQAGTIISLAPGSGGKWTGTQLYSFLSTDGIQAAGLLFGGGNTFYGLTTGGGSGRGWGSECSSGGNCGTVFKLTKAGNGSWHEGVVHNFTGLGSDGGNPIGSLIMDSAGNLYGTTQTGGLSMTGTAFRLSPSRDGTWTTTTLYSFGSYQGDGFWPLGSLVSDTAGNLYGMTLYGGTNNFGTVYRLRHSSDGKWTDTIIYNMTALSGLILPSGLAIDSAGNLYGAAGRLVFKLSQGSDGKWTETDLHTFSAHSDGSNPVGSLALDASGNLYGATYFGGDYGLGIVYELSPSAGGLWNETILHSFGSSSEDGQTPLAGVVLDSAGNLYGTTEFGGLINQPVCYQGCGTVFELTPSTSGQWNETILYEFLGPPSDDSNPYAGVVLDGSGNLYGTTLTGGLGTLGGVFEITP